MKKEEREGGEKGEKRGELLASVYANREFPPRRADRRCDKGSQHSPSRNKRNILAKTPRFFKRGKRRRSAA